MSAKPSPDLFIPPVSEFQKFVSETLARSRLLNAPYNPRKDLTPEQKQKLRTSFEQFGYVGGIVWNKRSGNLVAGHKRVAQLDDLHAGAEYSLTVSVVDLDEEKEKALNIILNSKEIGADFDEDKLQTILDELHGKLQFDLDELIAGAQNKAAAKLRKLNVATPPKMAWVLVGIPLVRYSEVAAHVETVARIDGTIVESTFNDPKPAK